MTSRGVVAVGDSITVGTTRDVGDLPCRSYARWVADAVGEPVEIHALSGASSDTIAADLTPQVSGSHSLGLVYAGVNDVIRAGRFDHERLAVNLTKIVGHVADHADRVALLTVSATTGSVPTLWAYGPTRRRRIARANEVIRSVAANAGVDVVEVPALRGRHVLWADHVHPTARGQLVIADAVHAQLGLPGRRPSATVTLSPPGARWDAEYAWWLVKNIVRVPPHRVAGTVYRWLRPRD